MLHNIEQATCCRPRNFENVSLDCFYHSVERSLDKKGWSACPGGSYMVGVYKGTCNGLGCIEEFKCCKMPPPSRQSNNVPIIVIITLA